MHVVVTWDHQDPADFRAAARKDLLARYNTTQFEDVKVESIFKNEKGLFEAIDAKDRKWIGRKVVLATGVRDIYPDIEGYDECWTTGVYVSPLLSTNHPQNHLTNMLLTVSTASSATVTKHGTGPPSASSL
jgi:thioredoxin reductase